LFQRIGFEIKCLNQTVPHNSQLADPTNIYAVRMREITNKPARKRTEQDWKLLNDLEWEGGLYLDEDRRVIVPGYVIEGALFEAGKTVRQGMTVRNSLYSDGDWPLEYDGPRDLEQLKASSAHRFRVSVKTPKTGNRTMRTRPIFRRWSLYFEVTFDPEMIGREDVVRLVGILGRQIGLSDDRRKMGGRFVVAAVRDLGTVAA
jgi:hypothetical protein